MNYGWLFVGMMMGILIHDLIPTFGNSYDDQVLRLEAFVSRYRVGDESNQWLTKASSTDDSRLGLFFGYSDDQEGCQEIANILNTKYPDTAFGCTPAN